MAGTTQHITSTAVRGMQWTTAATVLTALMQIGYTAIMARLLPPAAFGLVAMAGVVLRFGSYFAEMGLGYALVQRLRIEPADARATFTASLGLGLAVAGLVWLGAPLAGLFLKSKAVLLGPRWQASVPMLQAAAVGLGLLATTALLRPWALLALTAIGVLVPGTVLLRWPTAELHPLLRQAVGRAQGLGLPAASRPLPARYSRFPEARAGIFTSFGAFAGPAANLTAAPTPATYQ